MYERISKETTSPIGLDLVKSFLKIDTDDDDVIISALLSSAILFAERYIGIDITSATYQTYSTDLEITLRRAPFNSITSFQLLNSDDVYEDYTDYKLFSGLYGIVTPEDYGTYKIVFQTGYDSVPEDLVVAILQHVAFMYSNRGDCSTMTLSVPKMALAVYDIYKVSDIYIGF